MITVNEHGVAAACCGKMDYHLRTAACRVNDKGLVVFELFEREAITTVLAALYCPWCGKPVSPPNDYDAEDQRRAEDAIDKAAKDALVDLCKRLWEQSRITKQVTIPHQLTYIGGQPCFLEINPSQFINLMEVYIVDFRYKDSVAVYLNECRDIPIEVTFPEAVAELRRFVKSFPASSADRPTVLDARAESTDGAKD